MHFNLTNDYVSTVKKPVGAVEDVSIGQAAVEGSPSADACGTSVAGIEKTLAPARGRVSNVEGMKCHTCVGGVNEDVEGVKGVEIVELQLEGERLLLGVTWTALKSLLWEKGRRLFDR